MRLPSVQNFLIMTVVLAIFTSCHRKEVMYPAVVGTKTDLFEVVSSTELKLAPGVKSQIVAGPCGPKSGIVFQQIGGGGGYMACGCSGATQGNCKTENDNPQHPSCSGGCTDSEGNPHGCGLYGPIIGPPRDPARQIELRARRDR
jgi:hypothetical protein